MRTRLEQKETKSFTPSFPLLPSVKKSLPPANGSLPPTKANERNKELYPFLPSVTFCKKKLTTSQW